MQAGTDQSETGSAVVWCDACGIPYAATTSHCRNCGAPLAGDTVIAATGQPETAAPEGAGVAPVAPAWLGEVPAPTGTLGQFQIEGWALHQLRAPIGTLGRRLGKPARPLGDDEVEAAAAAIIARAQAADLVAVADETPLAPRDALAFLPDLLPDPVVESALQKRRERDRLWLIAGVVCSIVLILCALAFSRYLAGGLTPH